MIDKSKTIEAQNDNPGPGNYDNPEIDMNSRYSSKYSKIGYTSSRSKRFQSDGNFLSKHRQPCARSWKLSRDFKFIESWQIYSFKSFGRN